MLDFQPSVEVRNRERAPGGLGENEHPLYSPLQPIRRDSEAAAPILVPHNCRKGRLKKSPHMRGAKKLGQEIVEEKLRTTTGERSSIRSHPHDGCP